MAELTSICETKSKYQNAAECAWIAKEIFSMITLVNFELARSYKFREDTQPPLIEDHEQCSSSTICNRELHNCTWEGVGRNLQRRCQQ